MRVYFLTFISCLRISWTVFIVMSAGPFSEVRLMLGATALKVCTFKAVAPSIRRTSEKGPADITINTVQEILKQEMKVRKYTRIVVDSVTSLRRFYIRTSEEYLALQSFFWLLSVN